MALTLTQSSGRYALADWTLLCGGVVGACEWLDSHHSEWGMATVHWVSCFLEAWAPAE